MNPPPFPEEARSWERGFRRIASRKRFTSTSPLPPARSVVLTSIPTPSLSRQVRTQPSAVRRMRLQEEQKWLLRGLMKPIVPAAPGIRLYRAGPRPGGTVGLVEAELPGEPTLQAVARNVLAPPLQVGVSNRHELDEPHVKRPVDGQPGQVLDLVVVDAGDDDLVDLDRSQTFALGGGDAGEHLLQAPPAADAAVALRPEGIEADVDPPQAGLAEFLRSFLEEEGVRGHGKVFDPLESRKPPHQVHDPPPHKRLAAGDADASQAQGPGNGSDNLHDFIVSEDLGLGEDAYSLSRHTVNAAQVTAVGHAQPEVGYASPVDTHGMSRKADCGPGRLRGPDFPPSL